MPAHAGVLAPCGADWHSYAPVVGGGGDGSSRGLLSGGHDREGLSLGISSSQGDKIQARAFVTETGTHRSRWAQAPRTTPSSGFMI